MSLNKTNHSVTTRLTLWSALFSVVLCSAIYMIVFTTMKTNSQKRVDQGIMNEIAEFNSIYEGEGLKGL